MKKLRIAVLAALLCPLFAVAQFKISGKVAGTNGGALTGAGVKLKNKGFTAGTNINGVYEFTNLPAGNYTVVVSYVGFATQEKNVTVAANTTVDFTLQQLAFLADEVVVSATRVAKNAAFTYKNLSKSDLEKTNQGQDLPYLLNQTPSVVVTSDAGAGVGYTGIRIRGSDATRINVTLNGIPLNDAESQGSFFINLPDLASSVDNIQIQRGVGTSTNGAGAFGASLNIQTTTRRDSAYAELNNTYGSFETWRNTVSAGTGLINNKFSF
ncbi:MAG: PEGA domain-containing protein, partial [Pedobacter sp.]